MGKFLSFFRLPNNILISSRYISLAFVIAVGLITITATGGGGDNNVNNDPCDYFIDTCSEDPVRSPNSGSPDNFVIFNDKLIFTAWKGCKNTSQKTMFELDNAWNIKEIYQLISSTYKDFAYAGFTTEYNNKLYFSFNSDSDLNSYGFYSYDGVDAPVFVGNVNAAIESSIVYNGRLYFAARLNLWCYDEDSDELNMISPVNAGGGFFVIFQNKLYFTSGSSLMMIDGENPPATVGSVIGEVHLMAEFKEKLLCEVVNYSLSGDSLTIYEYDGTNPIIKVHVLNDVFDLHFKNAVLNNHLYFLATDTTTNYNQVLWEYDGINQPVKIDVGDYIKDIYIENGGLLLQTDYARIYFFDGIYKPEVLFEANDFDLSEIYFQKVFNGNYIVTGYNKTNGAELWKIDNAREISLIEDTYPGRHYVCSND